MATDGRYTESIKREYTDAEMAALAREIGGAGMAIVNLQNEKSAQMKDFNARIEEGLNACKLLWQKANEGGEWSDVEVLPFWDEPEKHMVTLRDALTHQVVRVRPMSDKEKQLNFNFPDPEDADGKSRGAGE